MSHSIIFHNLGSRTKLVPALLHNFYENKIELKKNRVKQKQKLRSSSYLVNDKASILPVSKDLQ